MCETIRNSRKPRQAEKSFAERVAEAKAEVPAITPEAAKRERDSNPDTVFVDPRDPEGIASTTGIIPDALNLSLATLSDEAELPEQLSSRARPIITACQAGPMGALAAHALKQRGYTNVRFMDGGTQGWLDAGYATDR